MKPDKIKITGPNTCKAIYQITKDLKHYDKCPIIMKRKQWEVIKNMVMREKNNPSKASAQFPDEFGNLFNDFFGGMFK